MDSIHGERGIDSNLENVYIIYDAVVLVVSGNSSNV